MAFEPINPWSKGDALAASHLNQPLATVRSVQTIAGQHPICVSQTPSGTTISLDQTVQPPSLSALVQVYGNETGGGKYWGYVLDDSATTVPTSTALTLSEMGTTPASDLTKILILNAAEESQSTHDLTAGTPKSRVFPAIKRPNSVSDHTPPRAVYVINGFDYDACVS